MIKQIKTFIKAFAITESKAPPKPKNPYAGRQFISAENCCDAATATEGRRFLIAEAPEIPLANCSNPEECKCTYRNLKDRRSSGSRRSVVGAMILRGEEDRQNSEKGKVIGNARSGRDRRKQTGFFESED